MSIKSEKLNEQLDELIEKAKKAERSGNDQDEINLMEIKAEILSLWAKE